MNVSCSVRSSPPFKRKQIEIVLGPNFFYINPFLGVLDHPKHRSNSKYCLSEHSPMDRQTIGSLWQMCDCKRIVKMLKHFSPHVFVLIHNRIRLRRERYSEGPLVFAKGGQTGVSSSSFSKHFILVFGFVFFK